MYDAAHFNAVKSEVERHLLDAETSKLAHWHASAVYERRHKIWLGLPALLLSLALSCLLSADAKNFLTSQLYTKYLTDGLPVLLSLLVSVLTGLGAFMSFNELAIKHRTAAENLHALWRDCRNWDTDFPDSTNCEKAVQTVQTYRIRLNEINRDAPQIPKWAWKNAKRQRAEGSTTYENERRA